MNIINLFKHAKTFHPGRSLLILALLLALSFSCVAQQSSGASENEERADIALYQALLDLTNPWTVMCVAAHPDDEDGATLTWLRRKAGVHTVTLFSTYGEGGQNAVGPELYEELGAIRARETMLASQVQGSEPYFLGLRDFGFSKSAEETFRVWNHEDALRRMVLQIRRLRPDVIITNHDTQNGHGHHQATGRLILEAFDAAANPNRFPEQLRVDGLSVWQPQRLFVRAGIPGGNAGSIANEEAKDRSLIVSINPNERDEVRGLTYAEQALRALRHHASQGPWPSAVPAAGAPVRRYRLVRAAEMSPPIPADEPSLLGGLSLPQEIANQLTPLAAKALLPVYVANRRQPDEIFEALVAARKGGLFDARGQTSDVPRFRLMTGRLDRAMALASGIRVTIAPREEVLVPDSTTAFSISIMNPARREARVVEIDFQDVRNETNIETPKVVAPGATLNLTASRYVPRDAVLTVPAAAHLYDDLLFGHKFGVRVHVEANGVRFPVAATTRVDVAPAVEITSISPSPLVLTPAAKSPNREVGFRLRLKNHRRAPFKGKVGISSSAGVRGEGSVAVSLAPRETREVVLKSSAARLNNSAGKRDGASVSDTLNFNLYRDQSAAPIAQQDVRVVYSDARVAPGLRVGYLPSYDESLRDALNALSVESHELKIGDVKAGDLSRYDTVIIDNRGYEAHPELITANARLLDYARAGGTLVVLYHKTNEWNPDPKKNRAQLAPYPLTLGNSRVTDENASVSFNDPQHPLLRWPNVIGAEDFKGWIQERGLYYPKEWDTAHYSAPFAMSDAGEEPLRGGLLAAEVGRGRYIYTSMVWYRQLRAGVPGAYRMFANMISYGRAQAGEGGLPRATTR